MAIMSCTSKKEPPRSACTVFSSSECFTTRPIVAVSPVNMPGKVRACQTRQRSALAGSWEGGCTGDEVGRCAHIYIYELGSAGLLTMNLVSGYSCSSRIVFLLMCRMSRGTFFHVLRSLPIACLRVPGPTIQVVSGTTFADGHCRLLVSHVTTQVHSSMDW
jgi:hypothetical protein